MAADWTFFYYCNAESDLYDNVITMMNNMSGMDFNSGNNVNILVLVDRIMVTSNMETTRFYTAPDLRWHQCVRFVMGSGLQPVVTSGEILGDLDMGDVENLTDFIQWGIQNFEARHYGLVIYGHGSGVSVGNMMTYKGPSGILSNIEKTFESALENIRNLAPDNDNVNLEAGGLSNWDKARTNVLSGNTVASVRQLLAPEFSRNGNLELASALDNDEDLCTDQEGAIKESFQDFIKRFDRTKNVGRNKDLFVFDIREGLESIGFKPDIMIFDSCFMQCFETALELHDTTDFLVGSQGFHSRAVMGDQKFLQFLLDSSPVASPAQLANHIINTIDSRLTIESIEAETVMQLPENPPRVPDWFANLYAISCIETSKFNTFNERFTELVTFIVDNLNEENSVLEDVLRARSMCLAYYIAPCPDKFYIGTIDLLSFLENLSEFSTIEQLATLASSAATALENTILVAKSGSRMTMDDRPWYNPKGLGIFYPIDKTEDIDGAILVDAYWFNAKRDKYLFGSESNWHQFILHVIDGWYNDPH